MIYTGVFFDKEITEIGHLNKKIVNPHVTHQFKPIEVNHGLFGQKVTFKVVGYGIDADNEGFLVEVAEASEEMKKALAEIETPHITLSISANGKAVNTKFLKFEPLVPFYLTGCYGGFEKGKVIFN